MISLFKPLSYFLFGVQISELPAAFKRLLNTYKETKESPDADSADQTEGTYLFNNFILLNQ